MTTADLSKTPPLPRRSRWRRRLAIGVPLFALAALGLRASSSYLYEVPPTTVGAMVGAAPPEPLPARPLTVLVWNLQKGKQPGWKEAFVRYTAGVDLALVQETWMGDGRGAVLLQPTLPAWWAVTSWIWRPSGVATGVATGATVAPEGTPLALRAPDREPMLGTPKIAVVTRYRIATGTGVQSLLVANVHGVLVRGADAFARQLAPLEREIARHEGPAILAGDFNTWSGRRIDLLSGLARRLGLDPVFPIDAPAETDRRTRVFDRPIDHAFVRGLRVLSATVIVTTASDHNALRFRVAYVNGLRERAAASSR